MMSRSPFAPDRYEYEPRHLYHLPKDTFSTLENPTQIYIVGSRGTGKTTLMKAMYWEERLNNDTLKRALAGDLFESRYLGAYIKLPEVLVAGFDEWSNALPVDVRAQLFGLFIDLAWMDSILQGVAELTRQKILKAKPATEHKLVARLVDEHPELSSFLPNSSPHSLTTLARGIKLMRKHFDRYINRRLNPSELLASLPVGQVGWFGRSIISELGRYCDQASHDGSKWYFKICLDEAECLSRFQQLVINTMLRLAHWPLFYVVSFVSKAGDFHSTVIPKLSLQKADRRLIVLDNMTDSEFKELAEGVATVRLRDYLDDEYAAFNIEDLFGRLNINGLLLDVLRTSESTKAKRLLQEAKDLASSAFFQNAPDLLDDDSKDSPLPIYQAYIIDRLKLQLPDRGQGEWKRRSQDSREIRKRMVAAYLGICEELGHEVRYASADMILQMSDKCIRDFLSQVNAILEESGRTVQEFMKSAVAVAVQNKGIKRASREKIDHITKSVVTAPSEVFRLVDGLGKITARIQKEDRGNSALLSSERGIFVLEAAPALLNHSPVFDIVRQASEAGYLRFLSDDEKKWKFRVHCSLAAAYGFSYRGAYYEVAVGLAELERLRTAEDKDALLKTLDSISSRMMGSAGEARTLFD
jgi:Cdc6-like AAA superfamily ATPase